MDTQIIFIFFAGINSAGAYGSHYTPITIANPGGAFTYYLALLTVDTAAPITAGTMRADGGDIRFVDNSTAEYNYWIESGLNTSATKIWVKVPSVPLGYTTFGLYYGDANATHTNAATDVFGSGIRMLYTFTEGTGTTVHDWVGGFDLMLSGGAAWVDGPRTGLGAVHNFAIGGRLAAAGNGYDFGTGDFSVFSLVKPASHDLNGSTCTIMSSYQFGNTSGWSLKFQGEPGQLMLVTQQAADWCQEGYGAVVADAWSMVGGRRWSGAFNTLFLNGSAVGDFCENDSRDVTNSSAIYQFGYVSSGGSPLEGSVSMALLYSRNLSDAEAAGLTNALMPSVQPTVTIGLSSPQPVAVADSYGTDKNTLLAVSSPGVLDNDSASGGRHLTASVATSPANGTLAFNADGSFIYMPNIGFNGTDSFTYTVSDSLAESAPVTVTITVGRTCPMIKLYGENSTQVGLLRTFRDEVLERTAAGRTLVDLYYGIAPVVDRLLENPWLHAMAKMVIDVLVPMVEKRLK